MTNELENGMPAGWETDVVLRRGADGYPVRLTPEKGASEREDD